jgi:hypothetical protein
VFELLGAPGMERLGRGREMTVAIDDHVISLPKR